MTGVFQDHVIRNKGSDSFESLIAQQCHTIIYDKDIIVLLLMLGT